MRWVLEVSTLTIVSQKQVKCERVDLHLHSIELHIKQTNGLDENINS